jgi:hypothetical protein
MATAAMNLGRCLLGAAAVAAGQLMLGNGAEVDEYDVV